MKIIKKNFKSKLHLACANDDLRPSLNYIYFDKEYLYCTNAYIVIKQKISLHDFSQEEIDLLDGKLIHKNVFKDILRYKFVIATNDGFLVNIDSENKILFKFSEFNDENKFIDNIKNVFNEKQDGELNEIGFNSTYLNTISNAFVGNYKSVVLKFSQENKGILVRLNDSSKEEQMAILMPIMISK